jgi:class 3 adenylate cyclase/tetratricopeptide (TPR) repeat protein
MVFGDVSGFTKMSERLARHGKVGAEEVADAINTCFEQLLAVAYQCGGNLLKFGGDALLLLFTGEDHATRAAHAAVGMRSKLRLAGRLDTSAGRVVLRISIGVHRGTFHLFLVGGSHRELIVAGPAATDTVGAEGTATAGEIVMSAATAAAFADRIRGPARGQAYLLRSPGGASPVLPITPPDLEGVDLSRHVPTAIRRHLLAGGREPEHRTATVAFLHFDGTDAILSEEGPAVLAERLHVVVRRVQEAAEQNDVSFLGTDIDHDGGKIILVSGVPRRAGEDEQRMLLALRHITAEALPLHLRIGVHTGPVFAGDVGTPFRRTFTVMGDTVNLAARLMAKAHPGQVLATAEVLERSSVRFQTTALEPFMVKGKRRPVNAFAVGAARRWRDHRVDRLPLTGVHAELAALNDDLVAVTGGAGRVVEILGEQGTGKSRLVEALTGLAGGIRTRTILCESYESTTPYASVWYLGRALLGLAMDTDPDTVARHLRARVEDRTPELVSQLPLIGTALDLDLPDTPETAALKPEFRRRAVTRSTAAFLAAHLERPFLLVMEDVHYMDETSQGIMEELVRLLADRPGLLCLTRRPADGGFRPGDGPHVRTLRLSPLTTEQAVQALITATDEAPMLPHEIRLLAERSMGNPMFLEELWRAHRSGAPTESLPDSVDSAVTAQIDHLSPRDRQALRYAAVLGTTFTEAELVELLGTEGHGDDGSAPRPTGVPPSLQEFLSTERSGLIRFRSSVVRDCAYEGLPFRRRRELHGQAGKALLARRGGDGEAELLALHFLHAQQFDLAWHYARVAGDRAGQKYANVEAVTHYQRALTAVAHLSDVDRAEVASAWESLGDVRDRAGDYRGASLAYRRARKLLGTDMVAQAELCLKEAWIPERVGRYSEAVRWIRRGLKMTEGVDGREAGRLRAQLMTWYAAVRQAQGHSREAVTWCERAIGEARAHGDRDAEAHALFTLDQALVWLGQNERANHSQEALAIYGELGDLAGQAVVLNNLGAFEYFRGGWDRALDLYARGRDARLATGNEVDAASGTINIAEILADQGHTREARDQLTGVLHVLRAASYRYPIAYAAMLLGRLESRTGSFEQAHRHFDEARAEFTAVGLHFDASEVDSMVAECLALEGRSQEALDLVGPLVATMVEQGSPRGVALVERVRGYALVQQGDLEAAQAAFEASRDSALELKADYELVLTLDAMHSLAELRGDRHGADELGGRIAELVDQLGMVSMPDVPGLRRTPSAVDA